MKDVRYAVRSLSKNPTFTAVAVLTIALGIGSVTAIYSVVDAVLLQELPYLAPQDLVRIWSTNTERSVERGFMSPPDIEDIQARNRSLSGMAGYSEAELALIGLGSRSHIQRVTKGPRAFKETRCIHLVDDVHLASYVPHQLFDM